MRTKLALADFETEELLRESEHGEGHHGTGALAARLKKGSHWHKVQRGVTSMVTAATIAAAEGRAEEARLRTARRLLPKLRQWLAAWGVWVLLAVLAVGGCAAVVRCSCKACCWLLPFGYLLACLGRADALLGRRGPYLLAAVRACSLDLHIAEQTTPLSSAHPARRAVARRCAC